jgi:hypothetical protein
MSMLTFDLTSSQSERKLSQTMRKPIINKSRKRRPTSAVSSNSMLSTSARGFGYFGDDNEVVREFKDKANAGKTMKVPHLSLHSDSTGLVQFKDLPVGVYTVEVEYS